MLFIFDWLIVIHVRIRVLDPRW